MRKFVIFAPTYNERQGGVICLHKLAHTINELGHKAFLYPSFENIELSKKNVAKPLLRFGREIYRTLFQKFRTNPHFNSPVYSGSYEDLSTDEWIVVYYEQVFGNPLRARNVVRWLLHQPGYHTGAVYYGFNELHARFNEAIRNFQFPNSIQSASFLPVIHYPLELYNEDNASLNREGTAFCIRKGKGKPIQHDLSNSVLIDDLSHRETAQVFKRVKTFISYDSYTAYSRFASLCGCDSVVIPDIAIDESTWYPNPVDRFGVAYGFENIEASRSTRHLLLDKINREHAQSAISVADFIAECNNFFDRPRYMLFREKHVR